MASSNSTSSFTAVNHDDFSQLDLNGKIMIKAQYLDDIRKISIIGDEITFDELILMMQRLFKLQPTDEIQLKYRDDDDDLISIIDDNDLSFAIQYSRILKLKVLVNQSNALSSSSSSGLMKMNTISNQSNNLKEVCSQLIEIRNRCNQLLEKLHFGGNENSSMVVSGSKSVAVGDTSEQQSQTIDNSSSNNVGDSSAISSSKSESNAYGQPPKELDPLNNKSPVNEQNDSSKNIDKRASIESDSKQHPVEQIAQQPVIQQAFPAPLVRPPAPASVPNQFSGPSNANPFPMPGFAPQPRGFSNEPPKQPLYPPPSSSVRSFSSDVSNSYGNRNAPISSNQPIQAFNPMPGAPLSGPGFNPPSGPPTHPPFMPFGPQSVPPSSSAGPPSMMMQPGPNPSGPIFNQPPMAQNQADLTKQSQSPKLNMMPPPQGPLQQPPKPAGEMIPPPSVGSSPQNPALPQQPVNPMSVGPLQGGPPSSAMMGPSQALSPPSSMMGQPPMQPGINMGAPPLGVSYPPPPPMAPQFNQRPGVGFSYNNLRTRYPTSGM
ncbi:Protein TFG [Sarcoptes scabiei]|uniref:Protein TFG n=1 Tax=Sarcoptes scabiei TaxID=52283 RepID=A0A834VC35_SARSC|nr:Protein TFG [Sarcoptes scabiei]